MAVTVFARSTRGAILYTTKAGAVTECPGTVDEIHANRINDQQREGCRQDYDVMEYLQTILSLRDAGDTVFASRAHDG